MPANLFMGMTDPGCIPADKKKFFDAYHLGLFANKQFRGETDQEWINFSEVKEEPGSVIKLQQNLRAIGLDPKTDPPGVFGYGTRAAVRLFQEYIRSMEGVDLKPKGSVGPMTRDALERWQKAGKVCEWSKNEPSATYQDWIEGLNQMKAYYLNPGEARPILQRIMAFQQHTPSDTLAPTAWNTAPDAIHLIGIRRKSLAAKINSDLFVLLVNGKVFQFWGSTNPNPELARKDGFPFLLEGQHRYAFGWHKIGELKRVYPALRSNGVLVVRLAKGDYVVSDEDLAKGTLEKNNTINIHWSGDGDFNFSAGCQVIAGKSYINPEGRVINCEKYAANSYADLGDKTRGAYNLIADLILTYSPLGTQHVHYSLISEERLKQFMPLDTDALFAQIKNPDKNEAGVIA